MELKKRFGFLQIATLGLMAVYLFIIISHLFFVSGSTQAASGNNHSSLFRRKSESSSTVGRVDKTVLTENNPLNAFRNKDSFIILLLKAPFLPFNLVASNRYAVYLPDRHHIYLSNRIIRI